MEKRSRFRDRFNQRGKRGKGKRERGKVVNVKKGNGLIDDPVLLFSFSPLTPFPLTLFASSPVPLLRLVEPFLTFERVVVSGSARIASLDRLVKLFRGLAHVVHERMDAAHCFMGTADQ